MSHRRLSSMHTSPSSSTVRTEASTTTPPMMLPPTASFAANFTPTLYPRLPLMRKYYPSSPIRGFANPEALPSFIQTLKAACESARGAKTWHETLSRWAPSFLQPRPELPTTLTHPSLPWKDSSVPKWIVTLTFRGSADSRMRLHDPLPPEFKWQASFDIILHQDGPSLSTAIREKLPWRIITRDAGYDALPKRVSTCRGAPVGENVFFRRKIHSRMPGKIDECAWGTELTIYGESPEWLRLACIPRMLGGKYAYYGYVRDQEGKLVFVVDGERNKFWVLDEEFERAQDVEFVAMGIWGLTSP